MGDFLALMEVFGGFAEFFERSFGGICGSAGEMEIIGIDGAGTTSSRSDDVFLGGRVTRRTGCLRVTISRIFGPRKGPGGLVSSGD